MFHVQRHRSLERPSPGLSPVKHCRILQEIQRKTAQESTQAIVKAKAAAPYKKVDVHR